MKKLLLIAFTLFSMNTFAQNSRTLLMAKNSEPVKAVKFDSQRSLKDVIASENLKSAAKAPAKVPEGTSYAYYMDCYQSAYGFDYLCNKNHVYSEIIITSDGKAYIPNIFYTGLLGNELYLEGKVNEDGSIEKVCKMFIITPECLKGDIFLMCISVVIVHKSPFLYVSYVGYS